MEKIIDSGAAITEARQLERLRALVDAQRILLWCVSPRRERAARLVASLSDRFPLGCWREEPARWRPYQSVAYALALWHSRGAPDKARTLASDLGACAAAIGTRLYEIRGLLLEAVIAQRDGQEQIAIERVEKATASAAAEHIVLPFLEQPSLEPLILKLRSDCRQRGGRPIEAAFLTQVADLVARRRACAQQRGTLTLREHDVMRELARSSTNKEIARALDMTEHTVKFHLKRIFAKLGVDRRARALEVFRTSAAL